MPLQGYSKNLEEIGRLAPSDDDILQRKGGAWVARTPAQVKSDLDAEGIPTSSLLALGCHRPTDRFLMLPACCEKGSAA